MIRISEKVSRKEKLARLDEIIDRLDIRGCLNTGEALFISKVIILFHGQLISVLKFTIQTYEAIFFPITLDNFICSGNKFMTRKNFMPMLVQF